MPDDARPSERDLWVMVHTPELGSGRALRSYTVVAAMAAHRPVDVLYVPVGRVDQVVPEYLALADVAFHRVEPSRGARRAVRYAAARAARVPAAWARGISPELVDAATRMAALPGRGRVIADGAVAASALTGLARRRPVAYCAQNVESGIEQDAPTGWGSLVRYERRLLLAMDESWMVSDADVEAARALAPGAQLRLVPNVVDVARIAVTPPPAGGRTVLLVADFTYPPNAEALELLLGDVMPQVFATVPDARLELVGRGVPEGRATDDRVRVRGFVDDLAAAYAGASCVVVPLLSGGGSPLKFVEALAHGRPVVATPKAAAGLDVVAGEHFVLGTDAAGLADGIAAVLRDGAPEVAAAGRALAEREYSVEALRAHVAP